jgi:ABC-type lipoprotein export system ATPase subunit
MMLKEISEKLGIQIIMVTHIPELISAGHKIFQVTMNKKISYVEEIQR